MCKLFIGADPRLWEVTPVRPLDGMVTSVRLENMF